jgi:hypothetical protein
MTGQVVVGWDRIVDFLIGEIAALWLVGMIGRTKRWCRRFVAGRMVVAVVVE